MLDVYVYKDPVKTTKDLVTDLTEVAENNYDYKEEEEKKYDDDVKDEAALPPGEGKVVDRREDRLVRDDAVYPVHQGHHVAGEVGALEKVQLLTPERSASPASCCHPATSTRTLVGGDRSVGGSGGYLGPPVMEGQFSSLHVRVRQSGSESITVAYTWPHSSLQHGFSLFCVSCVLHCLIREHTSFARL